MTDQKVKGEVLMREAGKNSNKLYSTGELRAYKKRNTSHSDLKINITDYNSKDASYTSNSN